MPYFFKCQEFEWIWTRYYFLALLGGFEFWVNLSQAPTTFLERYTAFVSVSMDVGEGVMPLLLVSTNSFSMSAVVGIEVTGTVASSMQLLSQIEIDSCCGTSGTAEMDSHQCPTLNQEFWSSHTSTQDGSHFHFWMETFPSNRHGGSCLYLSIFVQGMLL